MTETIELAVAGHRALERRRWSVLLGTTAVLAVSLVLDVVTGPALLPVGEVVASILRLGGVDPTTDIIVWSLRLPMALMAVVVGIALASGGAAMQSTLDNVLASPYTLGLASAAGFGASFAIVFGGFGLNPLFSVPACAFVGASIAATFIHILGYWRKADGDTIILAGIATMFLFHSLQSILQFRATPEVGQQIVFWMFGTLTKATWTNLGLTSAIVALSLPAIVASAWKITAMRLGEARAAALGVPVATLRLVVIGCVSLMTATAISFVGTIGFIGLVAPHIARRLVGEDQRYLLPTAGAMGAVLLSVSSVVSKTIVPGVLVPVGIVTALIGVPFFLHLLLTRSRWRI